MFQNKRDLLTYVPGEINQSLSKSVIPDFDNKAITLFRKFQEISNVYMIVKDTEINDDLLLVKITIIKRNIYKNMFQLFWILNLTINLQKFLISLHLKP